MSGNTTGEMEAEVARLNTSIATLTEKEKDVMVKAWICVKGDVDVSLTTPSAVCPRRRRRRHQSACDLGATPAEHTQHPPRILSPSQANRRQIDIPKLSMLAGMKNPRSIYTNLLAIQRKTGIKVTGKKGAAAPRKRPATADAVDAADGAEVKAEESEVDLAAVGSPTPTTTASPAAKKRRTRAATAQRPAQVAAPASATPAPATSASEVDHSDNEENGFRSTPASQHGTPAPKRGRPVIKYGSSASKRA